MDDTKFNHLHDQFDLKEEDTTYDNWWDETHDKDEYEEWIDDTAEELGDSDGWEDTR